MESYIINITFNRFFWYYYFLTHFFVLFFYKLFITRNLKINFKNKNGYAYIERDNEGNAVALHYIPSELVTVIKPKTLKDNIAYSITGIGNVVEACNMIHILNFTYDGVEGISTLSHAKNTLGLASDSEAHASGFFKGGANLAGILTVQSTLTSK